MLAPPKANVAISLVANPAATGLDTGIRFGTSDAAQCHAALAKSGVTVGELITGENMPVMFSFDDPDKNRFYVIEDQQ